ncbi:MAG: MXAN_6230/SCO0854 family RING domain-containing protein [Planctomycetota bacterium]
MHALRALFLRRERRVFLPDPGPGVPSVAWDAATREGRLLELGFVLAAPLVAAWRALPHAQAEALGVELHEALSAEVGAHRQHGPLYAAFPAATPQLAPLRTKERVLAWLAREPLQPCLVCGEKRRVEVLDPCGHLVCRDCWDDAGACAACGQRLAAEAPFAGRPQGTKRPLPPLSLTLLQLGDSPDAAAERLVRQLLARATPLSPQDRADLAATLTAVGPRALGWFPARIAVKESAAVAGASLLEAAPTEAAATLAALASHLRTATDVLAPADRARGQDPGLVGPVHTFPPAPALRRGLLELLGRQAPAALIEDLRRHPERWKRAGETLHPFERQRQLPQVALAFAVVRRTPLRGALGERLRASAAEVPGVEERDGRLVYRGWGHRVEEALRRGELEAALEALAARPGELLRRADHLLRRVLHEQPALEPRLLEALGAAAARAAGPLVLGVWAALGPRTAPFPRRVFFPKGQASVVWSQADDRPLLTADAIARARAVLAAELVRRASAGPPLAGAVLDAGLRDLLLPLSERSAARALVDVPRGSELDVPGDRFRAFLHWCQPENRRVDLDLSLALYDRDWCFVGLCDYTQLRLGDAAVHSGDFTSAPPPKGASEFLDLDLEALAEQRARYALLVVLSFNDVAFDALEEAFAGLLALHGETEQAFDPRGVVQRFDLRGQTKVALPVLIDLERRRLRWLGLNLAPESQIHSVRGHRGKLAQLGRDLEAYFGVGARPTLWDVATLSALRAAQVQVLRPSGEVTRYARRADEAPLAFWERLRSDGPDDGSLGEVEPPGGPLLVAGREDDLCSPPPGSEVYALWWQQNLPAGVTRLAASDLTARVLAHGSSSAESGPLP